jgi:GWxTD domain-containing protein
VKSSWTFSAASRARAMASGPAPLLALLILLGCAAPSPEMRSLGELTNPFLGPELSVWLVGPASRIATPAEIGQYMKLRDDSAAAAFVEDFWQRRNPTPERAVNPLRQAFDERSKEADQLYSEGGIRGRRTDRGTTLVLYGPPRKISFDVAPNGAAIEVWTYGSQASAGLDAKRPASAVRFIKRGELTVFYVPRPADSRLHRLGAAGEPPP